MTATNSNEFAPSIRMHHATRTKAAKLARTLTAEYPRLSLVALEGDDIDHDIYTNEYAGFSVLHDEDTEVLLTNKVPELADVLDACVELDLSLADIDEEDNGEEEQELPSSVVAEKYRATYRAVSETGTTCGDELAELLVELTHGSDGFNIDEFVAILEANAAITPKMRASMNARTSGWQGRIRMSGRVVLERIIAISGVLIGSNGAEVPLTESLLEGLREKHSKAIAKANKKAAEVESSIREAVEGPAATE